MGKFAPNLHFWKTKKYFSFRGEGLCPKPRWGLCPQTPAIGFSLTMSPRFYDEKYTGYFDDLHCFSEVNEHFSSSFLIKLDRPIRRFRGDVSLCSSFVGFIFSAGWVDAMPTSPPKKLTPETSFKTRQFTGLPCRKQCLSALYSLWLRQIES